MTTVQVYIEKAKYEQLEQISIAKSSPSPLPEYFTRDRKSTRFYCCQFKSFTSQHNKLPSALASSLAKQKQVLLLDEEEVLAIQEDHNNSFMCIKVKNHHVITECCDEDRS